MKHFWNDLKAWINNTYQCNINLSKLDIIFGITNTNKYNLFDVMNFCILLGKDYIRKCRQNDTDPNIEKIKKVIKRRLDVEKCKLSEENKEDLFYEKWDSIFAQL